MAEKILGTLTMEDLGKLRKMKRIDADMFLQSHTLTDQERQYADNLVGRDIHTAGAGISVIHQVQDPTRPLWVLAAWLAGASWRQLAKLHQVAPQTLMAAADRLLLSAERQVLRQRTYMSLESLEAYRRKFTANAEMLSNMRPHEVAKWLLDNTELDNEI